MSSEADAVNETRAMYDVVARKYLDHKTGRPEDEYVTRMFARFVASVPAAGLVVDVGCGHGREVLALERAGLRAVGVDLSAGMLSCAAEVVPERVAQADARRLPLADDAVDGIWSVHALLHLPVSDLTVAVAEMARVLRPGGTVAVSLSATGGAEREEVGYWPGRFRTLVGWSLDHVARVFEANGIAVEASGDAGEAGRDTVWVSGRRTSRNG